MATPAVRDADGHHRHRLLRVDGAVPLRGLLARPRPGAGRARSAASSIYAPEYLRTLYPGDDGVVLDVVDELAESLSVETELGCRLILRGQGFDLGGRARGRARCPAPAPIARGVVGELPEALRGLRMR